MALKFKHGVSREMNDEVTSTTTLNQLANRLESMSPITGQFVKAFANDELIIDCPSITLTQQGIDVPRIISGRGMISLLQDRRFRLRMYTDIPAVNPFNELIRMSQRVPGEIIPDSEMYNLEATDLSGT